MLLGIVLCGGFAWLALLNSSERDWARYKQEAQSRGKPVEWAAFAAEPLPPEVENFLTTPLLRSAVRKGQGNGEFSYRLAVTRLIGLSVHMGNWQKGERSDLRAMHSALGGSRAEDSNSDDLSAEAIIRACEPEMEDLAELRSASARRFARFEFVYPDPISADVPNFVFLREIAQLESIHGIVSLRRGDAEVAFGDVRVIHRLAEACLQEPTLVSAMIGVALHGLALQCFWEGWIDERWTEAQFTEFQNRLERANLFASTVRSIRWGEQASFTYLMEKMSNEELASVFGGAGGTGFRDRIVTLLSLHAPRSWRYQNLLFYNRFFDEMVFQNLDAGQMRIFPAKVEKGSSSLDRAFTMLRPSNLFATRALPNLRKALTNMARNQTAISQAVVVCALERFRRQRNRYPESLTELTPEFIARLPHDVVTGRPFIYKRGENNRFTLYSVGWNEKDDGGRASDGHDDWVWPQRM